MPDPSIRQIRASDQVTEFIRNHIVENALKPGDPLPSESELSRRLGVSRPTVREATNSLAGLGIINVSSGRAPMVGSIAEGSFGRIVGHALAVAEIDTRQTLQVRRFIEEQSVMLAAAHRSARDVDELRGIVASLADATGDLMTFSERDIDFHKLLAGASGNPLVKVIIDGIADEASKSSRSGLRMVQSKAEWDRVVTIHTDIAEAVIGSDPPAARTAMRRHFDEALERLSRKEPERRAAHDADVDRPRTMRRRRPK